VREFSPALGTGLIVALTLSWLGVFVVLRRAAFVGLAMAEASVLGAVVAKRIHGPSLASATAGALAAAALSVGARIRERLPREAIVALVFLGAAGLAQLTSGSHGLREIRAALEGDLILSSAADLRAAAIIMLPVAILSRLMARPLLYTLLDRDMAYALGMRPAFWETLLFVALGLAVATASRIVGPMLVLAYLVVPPTTALRLFRRWPTVMLASAAFAELATLVGITASYRWDLPTNATIAATSVGGFVCVSILCGMLRGKHNL